MRRSFLIAGAVSTAMWAMLLSLAFTGHTRVLWSVEHAATATRKVYGRASAALHRVEGDRDLSRRA